MGKRYIPENIKRSLRKESHYGCAICGNPLIEYHHIVPYHKCKTHKEEDMIILCPDHHHRADCGEIVSTRLYEYKQSPNNLNRESVEKDFFLSKYKDLVLNIGSNLFRNVPIPLEVNGIPLVAINVDENGYALLNARFCNSHEKLIAEIVDNNWKAYSKNEFWDVIYKPGHLKIYREKGSIQLEIEVDNEIVKIFGQMYIGSTKVIFNRTETVIMSNTLTENVIRNCRVGLALTIHENRATI